MAETEAVFQLKIEPDDKIVFKRKKLGEGEPSFVELKITNPTNSRQAFKVKCTSNKMFRISQPVATIESQGTATVEVRFKNDFVPESGKHYFVIYHIKCNDDDDDDAKAPRQVWAEHSGDPDGVKRLTVYFDEDAEAKSENETAAFQKVEDKIEESKENDENSKNGDSQNENDQNKD